MNNNNIDNLKLYICNESYDYERVMKAFKGEQDLINKIQINQQNPRSDQQNPRS
ncbi:TPA: hypothetical protein R4M47_001846, partial [Campylobacter jejuni]|nr:hypothetical protein [Campylobacter jejuni]